MTGAIFAASTTSINDHSPKWYRPTADTAARSAQPAHVGCC